MKPVTVRRRRDAGSRRFNRRAPKTARRAFEQHLELLRAFVARNGHAWVPAQHREGNFTLGRWVAKQRSLHRQGELSPERMRILEGVPGWSWRPFDELFQEGLQHLHAFVRREGHARVPQRHVEDGFALGKWVNKRRREERDGRLPPQRARVLAALPGWTWDAVEDRFRQAVRLLREYARRHGHARVPKEHRVAGFCLGTWIVSRRRERKLGVLSATHTAALQAIRGWSWDPQSDDFNKVLQMLRRFAKRHGPARVPDGFREAGFSLGAWVSGRRTDYRQGRLPPMLRRALERLPGWQWDPARERFEEGLRRLRRFMRREGHPKVPAKLVEDGFPLGAWVATLRYQYRRGALPAHKAKVLAALAGWKWRLRVSKREAEGRK
jgi:hypothetical protein